MPILGISLLTMEEYHYGGDHYGGVALYCNLGACAQIYLNCNFLILCVSIYMGCTVYLQISYSLSHLAKFVLRFQAHIYRVMCVCVTLIAHLIIWPIHNIVQDRVDFTLVPDFAWSQFPDRKLCWPC